METGGGGLGALNGDVDRFEREGFVEGGCVLVLSDKVVTHRLHQICKHRLFEVKLYWFLYLHTYKCMQIQALFRFKNRPIIPKREHFIPRFRLKIRRILRNIDRCCYSILLKYQMPLPLIMVPKFDILARGFDLKGKHFPLAAIIPPIEISL